jgi:hypothetical protein
MEAYNIRPLEAPRAKAPPPQDRRVEVRRLLLASLDCSLAGVAVGLTYSWSTGVGLGLVTASVGLAWAALGGFPAVTGRRASWRRWAGLLVGAEVVLRSLAAGAALSLARDFF